MLTLQVKDVDLNGQMFWIWDEFSKTMSFPPNLLSPENWENDLSFDQKLAKLCGFSSTGRTVLNNRAQTYKGHSMRDLMLAMQEHVCYI